VKSKKTVSVLAMAALSVSLGVGCSSDQTSTTQPAPSAPSPESPALPSATGEPAFGPAALVHGRVKCALLFGPATVDDDGTKHHRDGATDCTFTMDDPRVSGRDIGTWLADRWTRLSDDKTILIQWGTSRLTTDGGSWDGTNSGAYDGDVDTMSYWYRGRGAYKGLTYHAWLTEGPLEDTRQWAYKVEGIIHPGTPPDLP
jgi:hypothetical protein